MKTASRLLSLLLLVASVLISPRAQAFQNKSKVFVLTSTFGVMAGTLTGLASLAFYKSPGDHLRNVSVGASLGLYTGIFLGAYLVYFQPQPGAAPSPAPAPPPADGASFVPEAAPAALASIEQNSTFVNWLPVAGYDPVSKTSTVGLWAQF